MRLKTEVPRVSVYVNILPRPQKQGCTGIGEEGGERVKTASTVPEAVDRRPLAIGQQLVYYATGVSTDVLGRVTRSMSVAPLLST